MYYIALERQIAYIVLGRNIVESHKVHVQEYMYAF